MSSLCDISVNCQFDRSQNHLKAKPLGTSVRDYLDLSEPWRKSMNDCLDQVN